jgi:putative endonuclease
MSGRRQADRPPGVDGFREHADPAGRGAEAEAAAVTWLRRQGYREVARNVQTGAGEIDLVARDGGVLCFVEIKARGGPLFGPAVGAVTVSKQRRLTRAARLWLARHPTDAPCRFDVLGLDPGDGGEWRYTLVRGAFEAAG